MPTFSVVTKQVSWYLSIFSFTRAREIGTFHILNKCNFVGLDNGTNNTPSGDFMIFGRPALRCPDHSCAGRCNMSANGISMCSCDEFCRMLGDCCVDAHILCFGERPEEVHMLLPNEKNSIASSMECVKWPYLGVTNAEDGSQNIVIKNYNMISSCPMGSGNDTRCSDIDTDILHFTPVCLLQYQLIFRNIYCLLCHGFPQEQAIAFTLSVTTCSHWHDELNATSLSDNATFINKLWKTCGAIYSVPKQCEAIAERMQCLMRTPLTTKECRAYSNPVVIDGFIYKNQFCIPAKEGKKRCYVSNGSQLNVPVDGVRVSQSFTILLDFTSGYPVSRIKIAGNGNQNVRFISDHPKNFSAVTGLSGTVLWTIMSLCICRL